MLKTVDKINIKTKIKHTIQMKILRFEDIFELEIDYPRTSYVHTVLKLIPKHSLFNNI